MRITTKQATAIIKQVADEHNIQDAFDLFDASYIEHLVTRINQRPMPAGYTRDEIFAMWVCDDLGVLDCWDSTQRRQQQMDAR
jgi:hypothetical protein